MNIDWKRIAKPQTDAYDSHVIARLLYDKYGWKKIIPTTELTLCDGAVAVCLDRQYTAEQLVSSESTMVNGLEYMTPEKVAQINRFMMAWPEGGLMLQNFLDEYWAKWSTIMTEPGRGCSSGHYEMKSSIHEHSHTKGLVLNAVYVTANDSQGCSEGTYHEVGHARLESLGIDIGEHDGQLLLNGPDELYDSPVRWDVKRPMSAVVQAVYSWIMLSEADLQCGLNLTGWDTKNPNIQVTPKQASANYMIGNLPKVQDGLEEIRKHAKLTPAGVDFIDGYLEWGYSVVERSLVMLKEALGNDFDARYANALLYREERLKVLAETAEKLKEDSSYQHGVASIQKQIAERDAQLAAEQEQPNAVDSVVHS